MLKTSIVIIDLDQTLVDCPPPTSRPYDQVDWDKVVVSNESCSPNPAVTALINGFKPYQGIVVAYMTGRANTPVQRESTLRWLRKWSFFVSERKTPLYMRTPQDWRPDAEVKKELTQRMLSDYPNSQIIIAVDDKPSNISMWQNDFKIPTLLFSKEGN